MAYILNEPTKHSLYIFGMFVQITDVFISVVQKWEADTSVTGKVTHAKHDSVV